jgi:hypothetical protein
MSTAIDVDLILKAIRDPSRVIEWAGERHAALMRETQRFETFFSVCHDFILNTAPADIVVRQSKVERAGKRRARSPNKNMSWQKAAMHAKIFIQEAEHPLTAEKLLALFHANGLRFVGDELTLLRQRLDRATKILTCLPDYGYWPVGEAYRPAEYVAVPPDPPEDDESENAPDDFDEDFNEDEDDGVPVASLAQLPAPIRGGVSTASASGLNIAAFFPSPPMRNFSFAEHYLALDDNCTCHLCAQWRERRDAMNALFPPTDGHARSCSCSACGNFRQAHQAFLDTSNRRDLWSELSFHTAKNEFLRPYSAQIQEATEKLLTDPRVKPSWWAIRGGQFSLSYWFGRVQTAVTGVALALRAAVSEDAFTLSQEAPQMMLPGYVQ